jgi:hypothetical protein
MVQICSLLDLQSITQLSQVNRYLRKVCVSDKLWENLYIQHQGNPPTEVCTLGIDIGWKKVFYLSKLQLQKELSRRRAQLAPKHGSLPNSPTGPPIGGNLFPTSKTSLKGTSDNTLHSQGSPRGSATSERDLASHRSSEGTAFLTEKA